MPWAFGMRGGNVSRNPGFHDPLDHPTVSYQTGDGDEEEHDREREGVPHGEQKDEGKAGGEEVDQPGRVLMCRCSLDRSKAALFMDCVRRARLQRDWRRRRIYLRDAAAAAAVAVHPPILLFGGDSGDCTLRQRAGEREL